MTTAIRYLFLIGMLFGAFSLYAQEEEEVPFFRIEKHPYYVQTDTITRETKEIPFKNFLDQLVIKNLRYPQEAVEKKIQGRVIVALRIDKKGILSIKEIIGRNPLLEEEACRIFDGFPQLSPALLRGKPVNILYNYPIVFRITE
ncbi:TonB family domain protein [Capnocytophaga gingivalis ATCC 33624]|uniref:energy transducer TonB n=1 Tax=Capnocytophaga gingivalis TaxID=1017 RepID=UPI00019FB00F|nr:energy transducer TonB [Capnocytophaga gingivalis]EEK14024.1 TonB family domain protein [Capnocytophaga gingivalis ATCC 33624]